MSIDAVAAEIFPPGTPIVTAISRFAELRPNEIVLIDHEESITRRELELRSNRLAHSYAALGVGVGDFVSIALPNGIPFVVSMLATWKLGATPQPLSHRLPPRELAAITAVGRPALVVGLDGGGAVPSLPVGFAPDPALSGQSLPVVVSPSWKAPTSGGSTGTPKIIVSTGPAVVDVLVPLMPLLKMPHGGVKLTSTPLAHNMGMMFTTAPLITGGTIVIAPRFDAENTLDLIARHRVDWTTMVPTMLHRIAKLPPSVRERADLSSIVAIVTGGAMCPQWLKEFWVDWVGGTRLVEFYSSTESQAIVIADGDDWTAHPGTVGRVRVGELEVRDERQERVSDGQIGEIWMRRGANAPAAYTYRGAKAQADPEGWETVGDLGWQQDGWLFLADRHADMAVIGGANVYPAEVEGVLEEHPLVLSSCVVGIPDEEYGQVLHAFVQTSGDVSDDELTAFLRERLVPYKVPRSIERSSTPIRDDAGKVRRALMRQRAIDSRSPLSALRGAGERSATTPA